MVVGDRVIHEDIGAPSTVGQHRPCLALVGGNQFKDFEFMVTSAPGVKAQLLGHALDVVHQARDVAKDLIIHALVQHAAGFPLHAPAADECFVNMSPVKRLDREQITPS